MSASPPVDDALADARRIAGNHRLRIVPVSDPDGRDAAGRERFRTSYVVYRVLPYGGSTRVGKCAKPRGLLRLVRKLAGVSV